MAAMNEQQVVGLELERVLPKVQRVFERDDKFYAHIKKAGDVEVVSYREMRIPLELRPGGKFQYFNPDGGDLGRGSGPTYDKAVVQPVFMSENLEYTKLAQWATNNDRKAIENAVRRMVATGLDELRRQIDAQLMQPGTGVIGTVTTDTPAGGENVITLTTDGFGARLMRFDQNVQVFDSTLATNRGSGTITFWDVENKTIKINPQIAGVTAGDLIVTAGISAPASLPALYGVPYHHSNASTGTWLGFSRATTPEIRSNRVNAGAAGLSLPLPRLAQFKVGNRVGSDRFDRTVAWTHPAQAAAYEEIGQLMMSITKGNKEEGLNLYFGDNMQLAGSPLKLHFNWDKTRIDFMVDSLWGRAEIVPIGFYTTDSRKIFEIRSPTGGVMAAEIFYLVNGFQTFVRNPAGTSYIDNLAVPTGY